MAICAALAITAGTEAGSGASKLHFTRGRGNTIASRIESCASNVNIDLGCYPLMITRGVPRTCAFTNDPMAMPTPAAACKLTITGRPVA
jgi:hypothetical protein